MATKTLLTTYGNDKILQAIAAGTTVAITAIAYGDGDGEQYDPSVDQTSLKNEIGRLTSIVKEFNATDGFIYFKATIPANADAFTLREFGLIDDTGGLISVTVVPDIEKPLASNGVSIALPLSIGFKTSTGEVMVIVEDGTDTYANIDLSNLTNTGEHHFDSTYATIDLDNLSLTGERHFLGRTHITNCITEVPQRINYTLDNGTLTVKAGSVVIVPYGTTDQSSTYVENATFLNENFKVAFTQYVNNKFYVWATVQNDISTTYTTGAFRLSTFIDIANNTIISYDRFTDLSGTSLPTGTTATFYNTSTNKINRYSAGTETVSNLSFPIFRIATSESQIAYVEEIFNGISHMGSTIILDKDVRLLIPNGRNTNGSLNNEPFITSNIIIGLIDLSTSGTYTFFYDYTSSTIKCVLKNTFFLATPNDALSSDRVYYDFATNKFTQYISSIKTENKYCQLGDLLRDIEHISSAASFESKFAFRATDYNDIKLINNKLEYVRNIGDPIFTLSNNLEEDEIWLEGAKVLKTNYPKLTEIYGNTYAPEDAADTDTYLYLPDFRNKTIWGSTEFGYLDAGLPNITGNLYPHIWVGNGSDGAFATTKSNWAFKQGGTSASAPGVYDTTWNLDAHRSSSIYGNSTTVQPPSVKVRVKTRYI